MSPMMLPVQKKNHKNLDEKIERTHRMFLAPHDDVDLSMTATQGSKRVKNC
jgi:hypothetical protein